MILKIKGTLAVGLIGDLLFAWYSCQALDLPIPDELHMTKLQNGWLVKLSNEWGRKLRREINAKRGVWHNSDFQVEEIR